MERKYLSGNIRERLQDLMKERKITQSELAAKIGMDVSTLSRFISNATGKLGDENIKKIAKEFEVSTDFLLGVTDIPDRMNYDIAELGLSVQAAKNLYTGKVNAEVVNRLLENKNFAAMTNMIAHYFDDTLAAGYAAQNQMYATLSALLMGEAKQHPEDREAITEAAKTVSVSRMPMYQADLTAIEHLYECVERNQEGDRLQCLRRTSHEQRSGTAYVRRADKGAGCDKAEYHARNGCRSDHGQRQRHGRC